MTRLQFLRRLAAVLAPEPEIHHAANGLYTVCRAGDPPPDIEITMTLSCARELVTQMRAHSHKARKDLARIERMRDVSCDSSEPPPD